MAAPVVLGILMAGIVAVVLGTWWSARDRLRSVAEMNCPRCHGLSHHVVRRDGTPLRPVRCPICGLLAGG